MAYQSIISAIDAEIAQLTQIRRLLRKGSTADGIVENLKKIAGRKKSAKRKMSPEARARIAEAQRRRWAAAKKSPK